MAQPSAASSALIPRLIAETFGTFVLVFAVVGTALHASADGGFVNVALAIGLAVTVAAYAVGSISGGHFNPAVTLGVAAAGRMLWKDVLPYIAAQLVGAIIASSLLFAITAGGPASFLKSATSTGFASNGYATRSPGGYDLASVILIEIILTAVFLYIILSVTSVGSTTPGFAPLVVGFTLAAIHLIAIPVDNASVNPARSIATVIYGDDLARAQVWVFILAPIVGALIAAYTHKYLFARSELASARKITN
jgi:aquaporin Z